MGLVHHGICNHGTSRTRCISEWPDAVGFESQLEYRSLSLSFELLFSSTCYLLLKELNLKFETHHMTPLKTIPETNTAIW